MQVPSHILAFRVGNVPGLTEPPKRKPGNHSKSFAIHGIPYAHLGGKTWRLATNIVC
jgi:hypothetical protein